MMYLLDTNVVSELRKSRTRRADRRVKTWSGSVDAGTMFLSVVTVLELELGIVLVERRDPAQAVTLRSWLDNQVLPAFSGRILPVDIAIAQRCAALHVPNPCSYRDSLIAATALIYGLTIVTRNVSDFEAARVKLLDPWTWE